MVSKAQSQVISIVLITGIIISLAGTAYMWGIPIIEKRSAIADYSAALDFVLDLDEKIVELANSGSGSYSMPIEKGTVRVVPYNADSPDNNSVIYTVPVSQPIAEESSEVILRTASVDEVGIYGEAEPRIITMNVTKTGDSYLMKFKIHYRELDTRTKGFRIALDTASANGQGSAIISYSRTETIPSGAANNGDLELSWVDVSLV